MSTSRNGKHVSKEAAQSKTRNLMEDYSEYMPEFNGLCDMKTAMMWIDKMETILDTIGCAEKDKVVYAVSKLRSKALIWWNTVKNTSGPDAATNMTWSEFKKVFNEEYRPMKMVMKLVDEYLTIKQGRSERLKEYTIRFMENDWFVQCHVTPEEFKTCLYVRGLTANIREFITAKDMTTFQKAVDASFAIVKEQNRQLQEKDHLKRREGESHYGSKGCYQCGKFGHLARDCHLI